MNIDDLVRAACEVQASDLHLKADNQPRVRVNGSLRPLSQFPPLTAQDTAALATSMLATPLHKQKFQQANEIDIAYQLSGMGRFRVNIFRQRGSVALSLRVIPTLIPSFADLALPRILERISEERRGLVLVTGTTGSGKSTTLAAIIDRINSTRADLIVTIEDPLEFLHRDKKGFVLQREVEVDTSGFGPALRAALRQDPDVILVGEMRDLETTATALIAAETGHMVFSTLHTLDAAETVQRIISGFPPSEQEPIRLQLASTLKAIVSQRLVKKADGLARVPAVEVLINTEYIRDCIRNPEKTRLIPDAISAGVSQYGMQTFDQSLYDLYSSGTITIEEAMLYASKPDEFRLRASGIRSAADLTRDQMAPSVQVERFANR
jgi:twitching motility protein PilT